MRSFSWLCVFLCLGASPLLSAELSDSTKVPEIAAATDAYNKTLKEIHAERLQRSAKAAREYAAGLEQLRKETATAGDPDAAQAVKKEQERHAKNEDPDAEQRAKMTGKLLAMRAAFERACEPFAEKAKAEKEAAVTKFLADLDVVQDRLAKSNHPDRAQVVKALHEKIVAKGEVPDNPVEPNIDSAPTGAEKLPAPLAAKIKAAIAAKTTKQGPVSAKNAETWAETPEEGALLVGFEIAEKSFDGVVGIKTLRPIFLSAEGTFTGKMRGKSPGKLATVRAKPGYAVAGINTFTHKRLDGIQIVFAKFDSMNGKFLTDAQNTYTSKWYGSRGKGAPVDGSGGGSLVVGVFGKSGDEADTIGPIVLP